MTIENTPQERIEAIIASQKEYFSTGATLDVEFRKEQLRKLASALQEFEKPLADALCCLAANCMFASYIRHLEGNALDHRHAVMLGTRA